MPQYLIEVPHEEEHHACAMAVKSFLELGSHFLGETDWGCEAGVHKAWLKLEADSERDVRLVLPPLLRARAIITKLNKYSADDMARFMTPSAVA